MVLFEISANGAGRVSINCRKRRRSHSLHDVVAYSPFAQISPMPKTRVAVALDAELLNQVDALVRKHLFSNRSQAIEASVRSALLRRTRLDEACSHLDPQEERALAEEGLN